MPNLIKKIQNFAFQNDLWKKGSKIVLGVSGGPDSVCLLDIFSKLAKKYDLELHIAHVNYGLRGKDSEKDELFVCELGAKYGIGVIVLKPRKIEYKGNLENSLRQIRYDFFEKTKKKVGFDLIAVAHNLDDQAETVLMRIIRGSGLSGLGAMKAKANDTIRPLLFVSRKEILAYLKQNKLGYRVDKSNLDTKFTRNSIRHGLIPYLEKNFNPGISKTLVQWSVSVAEDYDFMAQNAERFVRNICKNKYNDFSTKTFLSFHPGIQRQVLRSIIGKIKNSTEDIQNSQIEEIIKVIKSTKCKNQKAQIGGLNVLKKGDKVEIIKKSNHYRTDK